MEPSRQTGKRLTFLQRGSCLSDKNFDTIGAGSLAPPGSLALRKMKRRMKQMKYAWAAAANRAPASVGPVKSGHGGRRVVSPGPTDQDLDG